MSKLNEFRDIKAVIWRNERFCAMEFLYRRYLKDELLYNAARVLTKLGTNYDDGAMQTIQDDSFASKVTINYPIKA